MIHNAHNNNGTETSSLGIRGGTNQSFQQPNILRGSGAANTEDDNTGNSNNPPRMAFGGMFGGQQSSNNNNISNQAN